MAEAAALNALRRSRNFLMETALRKAPKKPVVPIKRWRVTRGDTVEIIADPKVSADAGKQGKVLRVDRKKNRVYVEGVAMVSAARAAGRQRALRLPAVSGRRSRSSPRCVPGRPACARAAPRGLQPRDRCWARTWVVRRLHSGGFACCWPGALCSSRSARRPFGPSPERREAWSPWRAPSTTPTWHLLTPPLGESAAPDTR